MNHPFRRKGQQQALRAIFAACLLTAALARTATAQVATSYTFSRSAGSFTAITGGTVLWNVTNVSGVDVGAFDNNISAAQTIPAFNYNGVVYTRMYVSSNGFITFGSAPTATNYVPLSSTQTYAGAVAALGCNLQNTTFAIAATRDVRWEVVGNEVVVQWRGVRRATLANEGFSFQIRLNTSTNAIKVVYGPYAAGPNASTASLPQCGLRGPNNAFATQVNNRRVATAGGTWANPQAGQNNNSRMYLGGSPARAWTNGQTYTWTPCSPAVALSPTSPATICNGSSIALSASGSSTYTWSPATGLSATTGAHVTASPTTGQVYTVTARNTGCAFTGTATMTLNVNDPPNAGSDGSITVCSVDAPFALATQLGGSPDGGGTWSFGGAPHSGTFTPGTDVAGVYTYTASRPPCADATATVTVNVNAATAWYADVDNDGFGDPATLTMACTAPLGYIADGTDNCPALSGLQGDACDDGDPLTSNDAIDATCVCAGDPQTAHNWTLRIVTDNAGSETTWEIRDVATNGIVASGGPLPNNSTVTTQVMIPDGGHFLLRVFDSGNNGITGGGYLLRDQNGDRVIDNLGNGAGFTSVSESPEGFYSAVGTDGLRAIDCDNVERWPFDMIVANTNPLVSAQWRVGDQTDDGYEFWFTDPNGSYSRHIFRNHATSGGYGPADAIRACKLGLASWTVNPLPANTLLNVRIRGRVNGTDLDWGPACRLKVDATAANCHTTQLENLPGTNFSCGVVGLKTDGSSRIWAKPVTRYIRATNTYIPANKYKFHFVNIGENTAFDIVQSSYPMAILPGAGFQLGASYQVTVQASFDGGTTYCPVGAACQISFAATNTRMEEVDVTAHAGDLLLWPNPNHGDELFLNMASVEGGVEQVAVDVVDMYGKRVLARTIALSGGALNTVLQLDKDLANGLYLVNVTAGERTVTKRLVIQH